MLHAVQPNGLIEFASHSGLLGTEGASGMLDFQYKNWENLRQTSIVTYVLGKTRL